MFHDVSRERSGARILVTNRLVLRELDASDLDFVAELLGDAEVMHHYPKVLDRLESLAWIERQRARYAADGHGLWLIELADTGEPVGQAGLVMQPVAGRPTSRDPEIGYLLHRRFWKRGFATEAAAAVRDHAFREFGYGEVISLIRPENAPSRAVAGRIGMTVWGETVFHELLHCVYHLLRGETLDR